MNDRTDTIQKADWPDFKMPDISKIETFNGEDAESWIESLKLLFTGNNTKIPKSDYSHVLMLTINCKLSRLVKNFMKSQGSVIQKILAKDDATESDVETIIDILTEEYPENDEDDKNLDPRTKLSALAQEKDESLTKYMGRAKSILKDMGARDTTNQSKAMCFSLQIVIKAFIKGLYDNKLAERIL
ncbi:hypothetical protein OnM2_019089 [Erysiphe neolycopersici]|uniref:Retrotransposon gag domain-containing protein n=1 Tax=Erysiphe neolycopersici TaxID=212602 RepID=A0A420I3U1_9PEZI|nr:hypothetical protein OnM2_019089 [Erysiphe neolycopersici]